MTPEQNYAAQRKAIGTGGSPKAADGRTHIRDFACPNHPLVNDLPSGPHYYLTADRRMWLPLFPPIDQRKAGKLLEAAFPYAWGRNPSSGV